MAIGERIHFFRTLRGMTQKFLGKAIGFPERSADVRLAQYETGTRTPKADLTNALAEQFDVSPRALNVPDIDSYVGLMHTFFALEDIYGLQIDKKDGTICLHLDKNNKQYFNLNEMFEAWQEQSEKFKNGEITKEEYDQWRYNFPKYDTTQKWVKVMPMDLSDAIVEEMKKKK